LTIIGVDELRKRVKGESLHKKKKRNEDGERKESVCVMIQNGLA
jgi:hypothetical protein